VFHSSRGADDVEKGPVKGTVRVPVGVPRDPDHTTDDAPTTQAKSPIAMKKIEKTMRKKEERTSEKKKN
jgi:hypothetical protein